MVKDYVKDRVEDMHVRTMVLTENSKKIRKNVVNMTFFHHIPS